MQRCMHSKLMDTDDTATSVPNNQVAKTLVGEAVDVDMPLATQGLDSLAAMELRQKLAGTSSPADS